MRKFIVIIIVVVALIAALAIYLSSTTPETGRGTKFPLSARERALLSLVPDTAESFAFVPNAAALDAKLRTNPIVAPAIEEWESHQTMPPRWAIGGADAIAWTDNGRTAYALQLDAIRALFVRLYLMLGSDIDARWNGSTLIINAPAEPQLPAAELDRILALAQGLPKGDALAVQRESSRGAFPPLERPAVTAVSIDAANIVLTSHALHEGDSIAGPLSAQFARGAMISAAFVRPPQIVSELNRLFGREISTLLGDGGGVAIYDIDTRKLLPRPTGVIIMPASDARRAELSRFVQMLGPAGAAGIEAYTAEAGNELLLSFDRSGTTTYINDAREAPKSWPAATWAVRLDPKRLVPVLQKLGENPGLRIAAPKLHRSARDLATWIHYLQQASSIEAVATSDGPLDRLEVRIAR